MPVVCPRHGQETEIVRSESGINVATKLFRTVHVLACGEQVTLPSGTALFDHCRYTADEMRAALAEKAKAAEVEAADEVAKARARKADKADG